MKRWFMRIIHIKLIAGEIIPLREMGENICSIENAIYQESI